uniref:Uncharacterized protein n=1 Tax=Romanomermis culicivorax TaxID=13658 RepID=A0A915K3B6_ROMCU
MSLRCTPGQTQTETRPCQSSSSGGGCGQQPSGCGGPCPAPPSSCDGDNKCQQQQQQRKPCDSSCQPSGNCGGQSGCGGQSLTGTNTGLVAQSPSFDTILPLSMSGGVRPITAIQAAGYDSQQVRSSTFDALRSAQIPDEPKVEEE